MRVSLVLKKLHPAQRFIFDNAKRFNHLRCGRRWGKTTLIEELCLPAVEKWPVGIWYPTHKDMSEVWKDMKKRYQALITDKNETLKQITLLGGGLIDFWSMEDPESGQGRKYKRAILDESAKAPKLYTAWENTIRPTLTDYIGDAFILSRPKGKNNPFFQIQEKHTKFDNWAFFHFTTYDNPFIDKNEIEEAKTQLDDLNFRQEYLAEYVDANDRPFLYVFDPKIHVIDSYVPNIHLPILISFDFNKQPMTCGVSQKPTFKSNIRFDEITLENGSTPELCDVLLAKYPRWFNKIEVTGDSTGANRTPMLVGNVNHYTIIKDKFNLLDRQLKVDRKNMELSASRILCNSILQNAECRITKNCVQTIQDLSRAGVDEFGDLIKTQAEGLHHFDNWRYEANAAFPDFIRNANKYQ